MYIERAANHLIDRGLAANKVLVLHGARRVGKTALLKKMITSKQLDQDHLWLNGDDLQVHRLLEDRTVGNYQRLIGTSKLLIIDEAQKIPDIGIKLKLMVDEIAGLKILVTGSSVFDLANKLGEPLVGRKKTIRLHPLAQMEFSKTENYMQTVERLEERMIYGGYPELVQIKELRDKQAYLNELVSDYLLKDILEFDGIRKSEKLYDLLRLLAFQVGKEVSLDELVNQLKSISRNTVDQYLDLLSKVFVIYKVRGYSNNLRKEVTKNNRWYFYDNGIRNAIIQNFNPLSLRNDVGELWENYLAAERVKYMDYSLGQRNFYYWRTYDRQEIDWVEEENGRLAAHEFKWNTRKRVKMPGAWGKAYPDDSFEVISQDNYLDWITPIVT
ncbi:MAG: ATP-binding protein [Bacteroidota bacterium]